MKILFIKQKGEDYLGDSIYHGLKTLFGREVWSSQDLDYMYSDYSNKSQLYGKGFSLFCTLDPKLKFNVSEKVIKSAVADKHFDFIFYGSVWRNTDYLDLVLQHYPKDKIILFDGEDGPSLHPLMGQGFHYFKRELERKFDEKLYPISFSIPKEKFIKNIQEINKIKDFGTVIPYRMETYIFDNEEDYRKDYQESRFGVTMKKAGWDCMRHYEILANGCLPYFPGIEECPFYTMYHFPKKLIKEANKLTEGYSDEKYNEVLIDLFEYSKKFLTTEFTVNYILDTLLMKYLPSWTKEYDTSFIELEYKRMCSPNEGESVDIKEHLPTLFKYSHACRHITEMGVRSVVSTWAFLYSLPKKLVSYDIEYHPNIEKALTAGKEAGIQFDYILKDVLKTEIEETDFLFLDTYHIENQVWGELIKHHRKVRKYIGFHDVVSFAWNGEGGGGRGIMYAINRFLEEYKDEWEIDQKWENNNGLLIIKRIKPLK